MIDDQKEIEVIFTFTGRAIEVKGPVEVMGWGDEGNELCVRGQIAELHVRRNEKDEFSIRILPDGTLILTKYGGVYDTIAPQNLQLKPSNNWETEK